MDIVVNDADAWVRFEGDGPSNLANPRFAAKAGETNHVVILIGKTYKVTGSFVSNDPDEQVSDSVARMFFSAARPCGRGPDTREQAHGVTVFCYNLKGFSARPAAAAETSPCSDANGQDLRTGNPDRLFTPVKGR